MSESLTPICLMNGRASIESVNIADVDLAANNSRLMLKGALKKALGAELPVRIRRRNGESSIRVRIGRNAPAGSHRAVLSVNDTEVPVSIEVRERRLLRFSPTALALVGKPGGTATSLLLVENRGNTPIDVPDHALAGAFSSDGLASAFSAAYTADTDAPLQILGELVLGLRRSYLGLMRLTLTGLDGPIAPGESKKLQVRLNIPSPVKGAMVPGRGRRYHATFKLAEYRLVTRLLINGKPDDPGVDAVAK